MALFERGLVPLMRPPTEVAVLVGQDQETLGVWAIRFFVPEALQASLQRNRVDWPLIISVKTAALQCAQQSPWSLPWKLLNQV